MLAARLALVVAPLLLSLSHPVAAQTVLVETGDPAPGLPGRTIGASLFQTVFLDGEAGYTGRTDDAERWIFVPDGAGGLVPVPDPSTTAFNFARGDSDLLVLAYGAGTPRLVTPSGLTELFPPNAPAPGSMGNFTGGDPAHWRRSRPSRTLRPTEG